MLENLDKDYLIGVFTAGQQPYADWVMKRIDPNDQFFKFKFYRESCQMLGKYQVKDLELVKRFVKDNYPEVLVGVDDPYSRMVIVDNINESFQFQPNNGIKIRDWYGSDF